MKNNLTPKQKVNVELAARAGNKKSVKRLKQHVPAEEQKGLKIDFTCECSDPACKVRIPLTLKEYVQLHDKNARFVVAKGHIEPAIEKVTKSDQNLHVVEKYALADS
jgi:hypothetical protein